MITRKITKLDCRVLFALVAALALALPAVAPAQPVAADEFRVTLLGTGSPAPVIRRFGPAVLVQAGGKNLLFDCGRGATQRDPGPRAPRLPHRSGSTRGLILKVAPPVPKVTRGGMYPPP